jgi:metal-responsive CopG/Arc/MetJ family transcriptional regulator
MQTIAISIDSPTLKAVDRLRRGRGARATSRSELIRRALQQYVGEQQRLAWEARERSVLRKHGRSLNADALAALADQAEL